MTRLNRRETLAGIAILALPRFGAAQTTPEVDPELAPNPAEVSRIKQEFIGNATPANEGLVIDMLALGDNPAQVPLRAYVSLPLSDDLYCEEMILIAEKNPFPLACRFRFTPAMGAADIGTRLRLTQTQTITAYARLSDGRILTASHDITVTSGACGM